MQTFKKGNSEKRGRIAWAKTLTYKKSWNIQGWCGWCREQKSGGKLGGYQYRQEMTLA